MHNSEVRPTKSCQTCPAFKQSVFGNLDAAGLEEVRKTRNARVFDKNEQLFSSGNPADGVYCVESGAVKISRPVSGSRDCAVSIAGRGDMIGHTAVLRAAPHESTATTLERTHTCFIPASELKALKETQPGICVQLLSYVCERFEEAQVMLGQLSTLSVRERLARTLIGLADKFGSPSQTGGVILNISLSRLELADLAGTVVETTVRTLKDFKVDGLIASEGRKIIIRNSRGLRKI